jgi:hypothetical protein
MTETASGFVRIAALVMMSTVLGIVWRGDQQTQQQFAFARKAAAERESILARRFDDRQTAQPLCAAAPIRAGASRPTPAASIMSEVGGPAKTSRIARVEIEMELPAGIAPGTYQTVDQSGRIQKVRISAAEHPFSERDLYVLEPQEGQRRYFIRISDEVEMPHERTVSGPAAARR